MLLRWWQCQGQLQAAAAVCDQVQCLVLWAVEGDLPNSLCADYWLPAECCTVSAVQQQRKASDMAAPARRTVDSVPRAPHTAGLSSFSTRSMSVSNVKLRVLYTYEGTEEGGCWRLCVVETPQHHFVGCPGTHTLREGAAAWTAPDNMLRSAALSVPAPFRRHSGGTAVRKLSITTPHINLRHTAASPSQEICQHEQGIS